MAIEVELLPDVPVAGSVYYGDVHTVNALITFLPGFPVGNIGIPSKNAGEVTGFWRFDHTIPAADLPLITITKARFEITAQADSRLTDTLNVRLGVLQEDSKWDDTGFRLITDPPGEYTNSADLPHATLQGSDVIIPGVLLLENFAGGPFSLLAPDWTAGSTRSFGEGYTVDYTTTFLIPFIQAILRAEGPSFGIILDPFNQNNQQNDIRVWTRDNGIPTSPRLWITYEKYARDTVCVVDSEAGPAVETLGATSSSLVKSVGASASSILHLGASVESPVKIVGAEVTSAVHAIAKIEECP